MNLDHSHPVQKRSRKCALVAGAAAVTALVAGACVFTSQRAEPASELALFGQKSSDHLQFLGFIAKFGKQYSSRAHLMERYNIFLKNLRFVEKQNAKGATTHSINHFSDMTHEEFLQAHTGLKMPSGPMVFSDMDDEEVDVASLPTSVDWVKAGKVAPVKNQGACGSCWAFSTISCLETLHAIHSNCPVQTFSEQQLVDCDKSDNGCNGGWMYDAFDYVQGAGIESESEYPYKGTETQCTYQKGKTVFKNLGEEQTENMACAALMKQVSESTVGIAVHVNGEVMSYSGGIINDADGKYGCSSEDATVNHGVVLVGYGEATDEEKAKYGCDKYWKIRNSWGEWWGEKGYFRVCMNCDSQRDTCQVRQFPQWPTMKN